MRAWVGRRVVWMLVLLTGAVAVGVGGAATAPTEQPDALCAPGQPDVIYGTAKNDKLTGTAGDDVICGLGGDDELDGRGGNDLLVGGDGNDTLAGGDGKDRLFGEEGHDRLDGGTGNDGLWGGAGNDRLDGAIGDDGLSGGDGDDILTGADGDDSLDGGAGNDTVYGATGDDVIDGGPGRDTLDAAAGTDVCTNGEVLAGCERGSEALDPLAAPVPAGAAPVAPPMTIDVADSFPGVRLTIETGGGIYPWDVRLTVARQHMAGRVSAALVGPAIDVEVPKSSPPIRGATLTLPYDEGRLNGTPESSLRIWTFDADAQLWVPVPGAQTVDAARNTVTANLAHFSVYAVMRTLTPDQWRQVFAQTPVRCTGGGGGGGGAAIDVVFLVDISGSMSWNDPTGLRVDGAKAFVSEMRPQDRAAVVAFESIAYRELGLTALDTEANVEAVKAALERTRRIAGGTNISAAVREAIAILSANGGGGRLRVAVLLTDGVSPYDATLTTGARNEAIEIHTIGLGTDIDEPLLRGIADGTGATYRHLDDPQQLPALYKQLAGDIIGGGADTDGDGLSDCVERNGLFVPLRITFPFLGDLLNVASFITTDPDNPDTDGDGIPDGREVEARNLLADPALSSTYDFLVEQGLTTYYKLIADPTKRDSDGDGVDDLTELLNGTDPLVPNGGDLGIPGLPPFTLFQPARYEQKPAIANRLQITTRADGSRVIERVFYNLNPVRYDDGRNCVETCAAIRAEAERRPDDNGWGICIFGIGACVTDESQMRDIVEEARVKQGVFSSSGFLEQRFLQEQVALQCAIWFQDQQRCADEASKLRFADDAPPDDFAKWLGAGTIAIPAPGTANPETARRIAEALAKTAAAVAAGVTAAQLVDTIARCIEGPALQAVQQLLPFVHPCEQLATYSPGGDWRTAADHRVQAIAALPTRVLQRYATPAERTARAFGRQWYRGQPGCTAAEQQAALGAFGVPVSCDEFPNWSMTNAGPGASLKYIPAADNAGEGRALNTFFLACPAVTREANRRPFLVVPVPVSPVTLFHCGTLG